MRNKQLDRLSSDGGEVEILVIGRCNMGVEDVNARVAGADEEAAFEEMQSGQREGP